MAAQRKWKVDSTPAYEYEAGKPVKYGVYISMNHDAEWAEIPLAAKTKKEAIRIGKALCEVLNRELK